MMKGKPIAITIMIFALLAGAWSNVIAAAFCPRFMSAHHGCPKHSSAPATVLTVSRGHISKCDKHARHMMPPVTREAEETSEAVDAKTDDLEAGNFVTTLPEGAVCTHCLSHSQATPARASAISGDPVKSLLDADLPGIKARSFSQSFSEPLRTFDHGPPGELHPRYVLNSVFRI